MMFILFEIISIGLVVNHNNYQRVKFMNSSNLVTGGIYDGVSSVTQYFSLKRENEKLSVENAQLRTELRRELNSRIGESVKDQDSLYRQNFYFTTARVINNSVNRRHNYITLNKGRRHGVKSDMGVVSGEGVVGVVTSVSENYCTVISVLNDLMNISAKVKRNNYFGPISWNGEDYQQVSLGEIPFHVYLAKGDTIVTSGYSAFFPAGLLVGTIADFSLEGGSNFYDVTVNLATDFKHLLHVDIIQNHDQKEILELEERSFND